MKKTYHGSCHCGRVKFEADIDLARAPASAIARSAGRRAGGARSSSLPIFACSGEDVLSDYQCGHFIGHNMFCRNCGVRCYNHGHLEELGGDFVSMNLAALDDSTRPSLPKRRFATPTAATTTG